MSYSFQEPRWESVCGCRYDETRDEMDREDCPFHYDLVDDAPNVKERPVERKKPRAEAGEIDKSAA